MNLIEPSVKNVFVTGRVGVGKTTLLKEVLLPFHDQLGGFYTEEMKEEGKRSGFTLKTFDGQRIVLASRDIKEGPRVSKYRVDIKGLESVGVAALTRAQAEKKLIVVDEVGSMEILSNVFREVFLKCLTGPCAVLATIREKSQPFSDEVKKYPDSRTLTLDRQNYVELKEMLRVWIVKILERKDA